MAPRINWRKIDTERLDNVVKAFNLKIKQVSKVAPNLASFQPEPRSSAELRQMLQDYDRNSYNRVVSSMERYLRAGAEMPYTTKEGVNITLWEKKEIDNAFRAINARRKAMIRKYEPSSFKGTMSAIDDFNLRPRRNTIQEIKPKNFKMYSQNVLRQSLGLSDEVRFEGYKNAFLHAVSVTVGEHSTLYKTMEKVPANLLYEFNFNEPLLAISFTSDPRDAADIERIMLNRLYEVTGIMPD